MSEVKRYTIDELKEFVKEKDIIDVLSKLEIIDEDDVEGRKMSCAFHDEKTPSLVFYEDSYHCFGCGAHGDAFTFIQNVYDLSFYQACEFISEQYGIEIAKQASSGNPFLRDERVKNNINRKALEEEWQKYVEAANSLKDEEHKKYIKDMFPLEVGFDKRINYYVFRYTSKNGKTLGFTKRRAFEISDDEKGKYPKWKHSSIKDSYIGECANMYNLGFAIKTIRDKAEVILVEGPKDTIPWLLSNRKEVVAISGTHNKESVFDTLPKLNKVILSLDGDEAGRKGIVDITSYLVDKMSLENISYIPMGDLDPYDFYVENKSMNEPEDVLDVFTESELKDLYDNSPLFNKDIIVKYLSSKKHIDYEESKSFFDMKQDKKNNRKKKELEEVEKLVRSSDPNAMKKMSIKYGLE